jgi:hypothetical protein
MGLKTSKVPLDVKGNQNIDVQSTCETGTDICIRDVDIGKDWRKVIKCVWKKDAEMHFWNSAGDGVRRKRYNHELYELFNEPDIVKYIKVTDWAG